MPARISTMRACGVSLLSSQAASPLCVCLRDDFAGRVLAVMAAEPADVPFLGVAVAMAVNVYAHFDPIDVQAALAGFQLHSSPSS